MNTIWKFPLMPGSVTIIQMPLFAEILTVQIQSNEAFIWALVNPDELMEIRYFEVFGTGHPMPDLGSNKKREYIGTFQLDNGAFDFHLFELMSL